MFYSVSIASGPVRKGHVPICILRRAVLDHVDSVVEQERGPCGGICQLVYIIVSPLNIIHLCYDQRYFCKLQDSAGRWA